MRIRALVVEQKDAPFEEQEIDLGEPVRHRGASLAACYCSRQSEKLHELGSRSAARIGTDCRCRRSIADEMIRRSFATCVASLPLIVIPASGPRNIRVAR